MHAAGAYRALTKEWVFIKGKKSVLTSCEARRYAHCTCVPAAPPLTPPRRGAACTQIGRVDIEAGIYKYAVSAKKCPAVYTTTFTRVSRCAAGPAVRRQCAAPETGPQPVSDTLTTIFCALTTLFCSYGKPTGYTCL
jgi:hypothetical protein